MQRLLWAIGGRAEGYGRIYCGILQHGRWEVSLLLKQELENQFCSTALHTRAEMVGVLEVDSP